MKSTVAVPKGRFRTGSRITPMRESRQHCPTPAGAFPFRFAPVQVSIIPVNTEVHGEKASEVAAALKTAGFRVEYRADDNDGMGKQVRHAKKMKHPYWIILGDADIEAGKVTLESREGESEQLTLEEVIAKFTEDNQ